MQRTTTTYETIGYLASELRVPSATITRVAKKLAIEPALTLNGLAHYSADDCERIATAVRGLDSVPA